MNTLEKTVEAVEKKVENGAINTVKKAKEVFANVASHLPFANLAHDRENEIFSVEIDLPGVKKEDINVSVEGDHLAVTAARYLKEETKREDYYLFESAYGKFARSFRLSDDIDLNSIDAVYKAGRLRITFEKAPEKKRKDVSVK